MAWGALAAAAISAIGSAAASKGKKQSTSYTDIKLEPEHEQAIFDRLLPAAGRTFDQPRPLQAYERVQAPQDVFESNELFKLQQASDRAGGLPFNTVRRLLPEAPVPEVDPVSAGLMLEAIQGGQFGGQGTGGVGPAQRGAGSPSAYSPFFFNQTPTTSEDFAFLGRQNQLSNADRFRLNTGSLSDKKDILGGLLEGLNVDNLSIRGALEQDYPRFVNRPADNFVL